MVSYAFGFELDECTKTYNTARIPVQEECLINHNVQSAVRSLSSQIWVLCLACSAASTSPPSNESTPGSES